MLSLKICWTNPKDFLFGDLASLVWSYWRKLGELSKKRKYQQ